MWERKTSHEVFIHLKFGLVYSVPRVLLWSWDETARPSRKLLDLQQTACVFKVRPGSQPSPAVLGKSPPWRLLRWAPLKPLSAGYLFHSRKELTSGGKFSLPVHEQHLFTLLLYTTTKVLGCPTISIKYGCAIHPAPSSLTYLPYVEKLLWKQGWHMASSQEA